MTRSVHSGNLPLPGWPALLDVELACAYVGMGEQTFRAFAKLNKVTPVDTGFRMLRWRRADLDALIDRLAAVDPNSRQDAPAPDVAEEALRSVEALGRRRGGRRA